MTGKKVKPVFTHAVFGCKVNQAEAAMLKQQFEDKGFDYTGQVNLADVVLIHTCTVTHKADRDCRRLMDQVRKNHPGAAIVLSGCLASLEKERLEKEACVLAVIDQPDRYQAAELVAQKLSEKNPEFKFNNCLGSEQNEGFFSHSHIEPFSGRARAVIKIQDGCDGLCTYCRVRLARNKLYSKPLPSIVAELNQTIAAGYQEIVITGVNLGCWQPGLPDLLDEIEKLEGKFRIRLTSIEPQHLDTILISKLIEYQDRICPHIHIPIQSGSTNILKAMKRTYTADEVKSRILILQEKWPALAVTADMIVGFPGESEGDFLASCQMAQVLNLSRLHVFSFSKRPGTEAARMDDQVVDRDITARSKKLRILSDNLKKKRLERMIGQPAAILLEQEKDGYWMGTTGDYEKAKIQIKGRAGQLINATITGVEAGTLTAKEEQSQ